MTSDRQVLILSTIADVATDDVILRLTERGVGYTRINTENYPFSKMLTFGAGNSDSKCGLHIDGRRFQAPDSIWYRRMRTPAKPENMDSGVYDFCLQETRATLIGSLLSIRSRWMSHPSAVWSSEFKPFQLSLAERIGLRIPPTIVTNDPDAIKKAFVDFGKMIVKPVRRGYIAEGGHISAIFTSQVLKEHLDEIESARYSPSIYQALIPKRYDVRVTIVGSRVFAVAIDSQKDPAAQVDWRQTQDPSLRHHTIELPENLTTQLQHLMHSLGLTFGAIDLIQDVDGEFVFLEINPNGQWLWLDNKLELGISKTVARWLVEGNST